MSKRKFDDAYSIDVDNIYQFFIDYFSKDTAHKLDICDPMVRDNTQIWRDYAFAKDSELYSLEYYEVVNTLVDMSSTKPQDNHAVKLAASLSNIQYDENIARFMTIDSSTLDHTKSWIDYALEQNDPILFHTMLDHYEYKHHLNDDANPFDLNSFFDNIAVKKLKSFFEKFVEQQNAKDLHPDIIKSINSYDVYLPSQSFDLDRDDINNVSVTESVLPLRVQDLENLEESYDSCDTELVVLSDLEDTLPDCELMGSP